jgi:hypothetical protein
MGSTMSVTDTLKVQLEESKALSTAVQVTTVVVAPLNCDPDAGEQLVLLMPELSVAVAAYVMVAKSCPLSGSRTRSLGQDTEGAIVSTTLIVNEHEACRL